MKWLSLVLLVLLNSSCIYNGSREIKKGLPSVMFQIDGGFNDEDTSGYNSLAIRLYKNGTYSHFASNFYNYGNWQWEEDKQRLTLAPTKGNNDLQKFYFQIEREKGQEYSIQRIVKINNQFLREKNKYKIFFTNGESKYDPFSPDNNQWRIKPKSVETPFEIKQRTIQYLEFLKIYYQFTSDNGIGLLTYGWYPNPIQMQYSNGARMSYSDELKYWNACFYNEEQAVEGYKLLSGNIRKAEFHSNESLAERNIDFVDQLIKLIQKS